MRRRLSHRSMLETHIFYDSGYQYSTPSADLPRPKKVRTQKNPARGDSAGLFDSRSSAERICAHLSATTSATKRYLASPDRSWACCSSE